MEPEIKTAVDNIRQAFEEFKSTNDARLKAIEANGVADPLYQAKLEKMNAAIEAEQKKLDDFQAGQKAMSDHLGTVEAKCNKLALPGGGVSDGMSQEQREHKAAFGAYLRKGVDTGLQGIQRKAMSEASDPNGGYLVTADLRGRIVKRIYETSPMRAICSAQTITSDALEGLTDQGTAAASWVAESATRSASTNPTFGRYRIPVHELAAMPSASQIVLDDASIDVEAWLAGKVADVFARTEATAFVSGDGVGKPRGILSYTTAATADASRTWGQIEHVATGTQASWGTNANGADKLISLVAALNPAYLSGARFLMARSTAATMRQIKNAQGFYVWQPDFNSGTAGTVLGFPVTLAEDMTAVTAATDTYSVAFGNFASAYQIVDRSGIAVLRDPFTTKGYVLFYTTMRVGGEVIDFNAVKLLKFAAS